MSRHRSSVLLAAVAALAFEMAPFADAQIRLPSLERSQIDNQLAGRILIQELNCVACHESASADLASASRKAPRLTGVGAR